MERPTAGTAAAVPIDQRQQVQVAADAEQPAHAKGPHRNAYAMMMTNANALPLRPGRGAAKVSLQGRQQVFAAAAAAAAAACDTDGVEGRARRRLLQNKEFGRQRQK